MIPVAQIPTNAIVNNVAVIWYDTVITLIKVSALVLYARIFSVNRVFRTALWSLGIFITLWWITLIIVPWTFCHPARKLIDPFIRGTCKEHGGYYLAISFINASLDLAVLLLPMPIIWKLRMKMKRKIIVMVVFLFGYW